ncbi:MAG: hypothetical protein OdinLCB4_006215 [Candidatus Odinarchaeum yellowstonii]|uniref:Uncharacterized protein n=1 Tax=Odinarchaeota yellowstonii (strain LCB_4) TaxID=1841599 RepID=A0AAF0IBK7_ODILC|nr:MAG: hypothetical protein OdinLCB4_006215 [Candidatus Odinarchaeum yellowstonii]
MEDESMQFHPKYYTGMGLFMLFVGALTTVSGAVMILYPSTSILTLEAALAVGVLYLILGGVQFVDSAYLLGRKEIAYNFTNIVLVLDIILKCYTLINGYQLGTLFLISLTLIFVQVIAKSSGRRH